MSEATGTPKILTEMVLLRKAIGGLKSEKKAGVMFAVKSAKDLYIKLREALDELGMSAFPVHHQVTNIPVAEGTACSVTVTYRVVASDGSFVEFVGSGHGFDKSDKALGKASTYAAKDALTKGLCLPDKDMVDTDDESLPVTQAAAPTPFVNLMSKVPSANPRELVELTALAKEMPLTKPQVVEFMAAVGERKASLSA